MPQEQPKVISLKELQFVLNRTLEHIRIARGIESVSLGANYYWNIPKEYLFDMSHNLDSSSVDVGSLQDDWELIRRFVLIENEPLAINLATISNLLRYIGETTADLTASGGG
jgi:hypothetical protein